MSKDPQDPAGTGDSGWQRVHPVSPLVRGWIALAAIAYFLGRDSAEAFFLRERPGGPLPDGTPLIWAVAGLVVLVLGIAVVFFLSWWFTRYQVSADHVRVRSGVLFRQHRQARLDRVQAIDINQPLLARLFGLGELRFEVADAGESAVRLAYLRLDDARALRATILDRASGAQAATDPSAEGEGAPAGPAAPSRRAAEAPEYPILALRPGRVIGATVLSGNTVVLLLGTIAVVTLTLVTGEGVSLAVFIPVGLAVASGYWSMLSTAWNFRAAASRDGVRIRYGLLDTRTQTVPPGRIQAVSITQPLLWRPAGWYRISVNVAGYGVSPGADSARTRLLPAGTMEETLQILALVLPNPGTDDPVGLFRAGLAGSGPEHGFTTSPRRARWVAPLQWRRSGFALTGTALLSRTGRLWRSLTVVPHERIQSMALEQGPLARRLRIADLRLHSTPGPVSPRIRQLDQAVLLELFNEQSVRAADARRRDRTERWLHRETATGPAVPDAAPAAVPGPPAAAPEQQAPGPRMEENWNEHR
ncbi:PH domain-containing protein [Arthrobacter koreensis]|uniref:PH domain-containing protein n=1 Tax=Arthrobacter koreensis TaxID=199136 RepID=UPI002DB7A165|nr:PH domain-containing protein [Arthrobacter koreensis]MEB7503081.1 PH domain-containing protein [Arthrobacter koreensis]